jgi:hypothetical protein
MGHNVAQAFTCLLAGRYTFTYLLYVKPSHQICDAGVYLLALPKLVVLGEDALRQTMFPYLLFLMLALHLV